MVESADIQNLQTLPNLDIEYVLSSIKNKGPLSWQYKPFFNLRDSTGKITNLDTDKLDFSLLRPVNMIVQSSYDGSINLILNDGNSIPRLINSRFTVRENGTYERVDRIGENDTNLYDISEFNLQTSLQKLYKNIPTILFDGESMSGNLLVGNYIFYFTYCDADGNETDIVAESGIVSIFKGLNRIPHNIEGGFRNENSYKSILFTLKNIDFEYNYIKVYYIRFSGDMNEHKTTNAYRIYLKYPVKNNRCTITISGFENKEEIDESVINNLYTTIDSSKTQEIVQNRLFLGNIGLSTPLYKDLLDLSLRITVHYKKNDNLIGKLDHRYNNLYISDNDSEYYNSSNLYNYVGYAPGELYRFGIVYILENNTLTPVFNVRGTRDIPSFDTSPENDNYSTIELVYVDGKRQYINKIDDVTGEFIGGKTNENAKGVITIPKDLDDLSVFSVVFKINGEDIISELKKCKVKGYFFVRLKRIQLSLGLALTLPIEPNTSLPSLPVIGEDGFVMESFMDYNRVLTHDYKSRLLHLNKGRDYKQSALLFPEYEVNQPLYNSILTGGKFQIKEAKYNNNSEGLSRDPYNERHYYITRNSNNTALTYDTNLILVPDNVKLVGIDDYKFSARAGEAEEGFRYEKPRNVNTSVYGVSSKIEASNSESTNSINYIRGSYGPYIGCVSDNIVRYGKIVDVYIPGYSEVLMSNYFKIRYNDTSNYNAVSDRFNLTNVDDFNSKNIFRGDSYICNFTHRLNRNFNDATAPINDRVVDPDTWKDNFKVKKGIVLKEKFEEINLGDINAVKLGSWITFKVRSTTNLSVRSQDTSNVDETSLFGHPRSFYPLTPMNADGSYKIPDSFVFNDAFNASLGIKHYFNLPEIPYLKDSFLTRIYYSDIYVNDTFINGCRRILASSYRDYETLYGGLVKLISYGRDLICIFEHGITKLSINLSTPISLNESEPIFLNAHNVLPESMFVISDTVGSQWADSVIKSDSYIYGVDTHAKKIWRYNSGGIEYISDNTILLFLNNNITFKEGEVLPYIGIRNVKTHYNRNKGDIMFTYYDDVSTTKETVWNLCWNEKVDRWVTFYSWVPSFSENIYNTFFSFDRNSSKYMAKIAASFLNSKDCIKVGVSGTYIEDVTLTYLDKVNVYENLEPIITFSKENDIYNFYKYYSINNDSIVIEDSEKIKEIMERYELPVALFDIKVNISYGKTSDTYSDVIKSGKYIPYNADSIYHTIALTTENIYKSKLSELLTKPNLSSWFWKHGKTGIFNITDEILPTNWYKKLHPFELEFVINSNLDYHKIFDNLLIISNNAEPESFHYEIVGDSFAFSNDKLNMYIRQEATKNLYYLNGFDVNYDQNYLKLLAIHRPLEEGSDLFDKSTLMPLYYSRLDKLNTIEDYYHLKDDIKTKDFSMLAGGEIVKNSRNNEYHLWNHAKAVDLSSTNRLRGNMHYKEDKWHVLINPINIVLKNEETWKNNLIPIELGQSPIPNEILEKGNIILPDEERDVITWDWDESENSEVKVKDKWMKVRIRYKGDKLTTIHSIQTFYNITTS